jgi:excisionase family DNA binding protein
MTTVWMGVADAAAIAGCSRLTILRAVKTGRLVAYRAIGSRVWRIDANDLDTFLRGQRNAAATVQG